MRLQILDKKKSTLITTNKAFSEWSEVFPQGQSMKNRLRS